MNVADMKVDMEVDLVVGKVANMKVDMVADMGVDLVDGLPIRVSQNRLFLNKTENPSKDALQKAENFK